MGKQKPDPAARALEFVQAAVAKQIGARGFSVMANARSLVDEAIPTELSVLDRYVLGCGGLPVGRISEIYSAEGGGKSAFSLHCLAACQRAGGLALLADDEESLSEDRARVFGVDVKRLGIIQPGSTEETLDAQLAAVSAIPKGVGPNLLVWDSVAASVPEAELRGEAGDQARAALARVLGPMVRKISKLLAAKRCHWMIVNQTRQQMGVIYGDATTTPGGKVIKFHASTRLQLFGGKSLKDKVGQHVGKVVTFLGTKNRFAPPYRKARVRLLYAHGWEDNWSVVDHAKNLHVVPKGTTVAEGLPRAVSWFTTRGWDASPENEPGAAAPDADALAEEVDDGLEG